MKGDFTRFTFRPEKHYTSVLMQQGRLQLDSDWNEQANIHAYLSQVQMRDTIGGFAGTPGGETKEGFKIAPTPDGTDLIINPGSFYVGGVLCELAEGSEFSAAYTAASIEPAPTLTVTVTVTTFVVDGQLLEPNQWLVDLSSDQLLRIIEVNPQQQTLKLKLTQPFDIPPPEAQKQLRLRRVLTYATQPDYPLAPALQPSTHYLVYLDVWQRHITAIEDPQIREVALVDIPDTTTRTKTIWQVKLLALGNDAIAKLESDVAYPLETSPEWLRLTQKQSGLLTAQVVPTNGSTNDLGLDNRLYRVEIHTPGDLKTATFKWSRDNGTVVSAIKTINVQESTLTLPRPSRDSLLSFKAGQWIEVTDEVRELNNRPGTLVRLKDVIVKAEEKLSFDLTRIFGDPITPENFPTQHKPKVRRWDQSEADLKLTSTNPKGIELENGISIQFGNEDAMFQTGDYWLVPTRMNSENLIDLPHEIESKRSLPQPPLGILHQFGLLALVNTLEAQGITDQNITDQNITDKRLVFPPLINCFDKNGDFFSGSLGIGINPPLAKLHIVGTPESKTGTISISQTDLSTVTGNKTKFKQDIHSNGLIAVTDLKTGKTETRIIKEVKSDQLLTVTEAFSGDFSQAPFTYQQPAIIRGDALTTQVDGTQKFTPQFLLDSRGNVGIGTSQPSAKLQVDGLFKISTGQDYVQIKQDPNQVSFETTYALYRFDREIKVETGVISAGVIPNNAGLMQDANLSLKTSGTERLGISKDGKVSLNAPISDTTLEVKGAASPLTQIFQVTLNNSSLFAVQNDGNTRVGDGTPNRTFTVLGKTAIGQGAAIAEAPDDGLLVQGGIQTQSTLQVLGKAAIGQGAAIANAPDDGLLVKGSIQAQNTVGININPAATSAKLHVNGLVRIGDETAFVEIKPPTTDSKQISFIAPTTATNGYSFDQSLTLTTGSLNVSQGSATLATGLTVTSGDITVSKGNITVNEGGLTFSKGAIASTLNDTGLTLGTGIIKSSSSTLSLQTTSLQAAPVERIKLSGKGVEINTEDLKHPAELGLLVSGQTVIGKRLAANKEGIPENGLLVEGDVGIGIGITNFTELPSAKLDITGTKRPDGFALKVKVEDQNRTDTYQELFSVKNNGDVVVNTRLLVGAKTPDIAGSEGSKLYVKGTIFGQQITATNLNAEQFGVFSSRTLKENIAELSSPEVDTILRGLSPVKFTYKTDDTQTIHLGFIAEDVPAAVASSDRQTICPVEIVATLTKAVKDHRQVILLLNKLVKEQQSAIATLTEKVNALETKQN